MGVFDQLLVVISRFIIDISYIYLPVCKLLWSVTKGLQRVKLNHLLPDLSLIAEVLLIEDPLMVVSLAGLAQERVFT